MSHQSCGLAGESEGTVCAWVTRHTDLGWREGCRERDGTRVRYRLTSEKHTPDSRLVGLRYDRTPNPRATASLLAAELGVIAILAAAAGAGDRRVLSRAYCADQRELRLSGCGRENNGAGVECL